MPQALVPSPPSRSARPEGEGSAIGDTPAYPVAMVTKIPLAQEVLLSLLLGG